MSGASYLPPKLGGCAPEARGGVEASLGNGFRRKPLFAAFGREELVTMT